MRKSYRKGPIRALMDEYERAGWELRRLVEQISEDDVMRIVDPQAEDDACRSVRTIKYSAHMWHPGMGADAATKAAVSALTLTTALGSLTFRVGISTPHP